MTGFSHVPLLPRGPGPSPADIPVNSPAQVPTTLGTLSLSSADAMTGKTTKAATMAATAAFLMLGLPPFGPLRRQSKHHAGPRFVGPVARPPRQGNASMPG